MINSGTEHYSNPVLRRFLKTTVKQIRHAFFGPTRAELYDIQTVHVLRRVLQEDSVCIDVGAHVGDILREIVAIAPRARHHAIEALPHLASWLKKEFPRVAVHACAVSDVTAEEMFNYVENAPAYSGLRQRKYDRSDPIVRQIPIPVRRIDDLIPEDVPVRLIKLDIEGGEYHALLGAMKTLLRCKPVVIFEFGLGGADFYKVTPSMIFSLFCDEARLHISTMERYLSGKPPYDLTMFTESFESGDDFNFIAYP